MSHMTYLITLSKSAPAGEAEETLILARLAAESLHGEVEFLLDSRHRLEPEGRVCIDAGTPAGRDLARIFVHLLAKEFGPTSFSVERVAEPEPVGV